MVEAIHTRPDGTSHHFDRNPAVLTSPENQVLPTLHFAFATPGISTDDEHVASQITTSDAVIFGNIFPTPTVMEIISKVSSGELSPRRAVRNHSIKENADDMNNSMRIHLTALYGSEKPVFFLGTDASHPLAQALATSDSSQTNIFNAKFLLAHPFSDVVDATQEYLQNFGQSQRDYMNYMAEQLTEFPAVCAENSLAPTSAAVILPPLYRPILTHIAASNIPSTTNRDTHSHESFYYKAKENAVNDQPISDELAAKVLTEIWAAESYDPRSLFEFLDGKSISDKDALAYGTDIAHALSFQESEFVFTHFTQKKRIPLSKITKRISMGRFQEGLNIAFTLQSGGKLPQQMGHTVYNVIPPTQASKLTL